MMWMRCVKRLVSVMGMVASYLVANASWTWATKKMAKKIVNDVFLPLVSSPVLFLSCILCISYMIHRTRKSFLLSCSLLFSSHSWRLNLRD